MFSVILYPLGQARKLCEKNFAMLPHFMVKTRKGFGQAACLASAHEKLVVSSPFKFEKLLEDINCSWKFTRISICLKIIKFFFNLLYLNFVYIRSKCLVSHPTQSGNITRVNLPLINCKFNYKLSLFKILSHMPLISIILMLYVKSL